MASPEQKVVFPEISPGCDGALEGVTVVSRGSPEPHPLLAVTLTFPPVAPTVTEIEFVVDVPVQPFGNIQVYDVAPPAAVT